MAAMFFRACTIIKNKKKRKKGRMRIKFTSIGVG